MPAGLRQPVLRHVICRPGAWVEAHHPATRSADPRQALLMDAVLAISPQLAIPVDTDPAEIVDIHNPSQGCLPCQCQC